MSTTKEIWVLIDRADGDLGGPGTELLATATALAVPDGGSVRAIGCSEIGSDELAEIVGRAGATKLTIVGGSGDRIAQQVDVVARMLEDLAPRIVLIPGSATGAEIAARLAIRLDLRLVCDCVSLELNDDGGIVAGIGSCGGMAVLETEIDAEQPLLVLGSRFEVAAAQCEGSQVAEIDTLAAAPTDPNAAVSLQSEQAVSPDDMSLAESPVIVSGGRGLGGPEGFEPLFALAELLEGKVGASRVTTDLNWIDREHLVGVSGTTVRPAVYLAFGISGDPHHLMGMQDSQTIVAVNLDPKAPIFHVADLGLIGDVAEVVPALIDRISQQQATTG